MDFAPPRMSKATQPVSDSRSQWYRYAVIFTAVITARLVFHWLTGFLFDDAFITFRYAENIAAGNGFVFNPGERVLGTTTPLFTLILAALVRSGLSPITGALGVSLICSGLTAILVYRLAQSWDFGEAAVLPVVIYVFFPRLLATDTGGMETALFTLLVTAAVYFREIRRPFAAVGAAALASVTRPEGLLLLVMIIAVEGSKDFRRAVRHAGISSVIILPWVVFAILYFGSVIPNSVAAKLALYSRFGTGSPLGNIVFLLGLHNALGVILLVLACAGGWYLLFRRRVGGFALLWLGILLAGYAVSRTHLFLWYLAPVYPIYILLAGASASCLADHRHRFRGLAIVGPGALAVLALIGLSIASVRTIHGYREYQQTNEDTLLAIGQFLRDNAGTQEIVAGEDIGYMSFYSGRRFIDRDGLVTPQAVPYNRSGDYFGVILECKPDWVVAMPKGKMSDFIDGTTFKATYGLVRTFGAAPGPVYQVYKRTSG